MGTYRVIRLVDAHFGWHYDTRRTIFSTALQLAFVMALRNMFRRGKNGERLAQAVLAQLGEKKDPVRVEVEGTPMYFAARLALRSGSVVVTRPEDAVKLLKRGGWIRVRTGLEENQELRLQISSPVYGPQKNSPYFMCKIPGAVAEQAKRASDRLSTAMFKNLVLQIHHHPYQYRILDVSMGGMRVRLIPREASELFPLDSAQEYGTILLGKKGKIQLDTTTARHHFPDAVGLEMVVSSKNNSAKWLEVFLETLEKAAAKRAAEAAQPASAAQDGSAISSA